MITDKIPKPPFRYKKILTGVIIITGVFVMFIIGHILIYGRFNLSNCIYTEKLLETPSELQNYYIKLEQDMYVAVGKNPSHCSDSFKNVSHEIINPEDIANTTVGKDYFINQGRTVSSLVSGQIFSIDKIVSQTQHGISTIDSGPGPIVYLILKDNRGVLYEIADVSLEDINQKAGPFFGIYQNGQRTKTLTADMFE